MSDWVVADDAPLTSRERALMMYLAKYSTLDIVTDMEDFWAYLEGISGLLAKGYIHRNVSPVVPPVEGMVRRLELTNAGTALLRRAAP